MVVIGALACVLGVIGLAVLLVNAGLPLWVIIGVVAVFVIGIAFDTIFDALRR